MKTRSLLLLLAFTIMLPQATDCQVRNLIKNKVNRAINAGAKTGDKEVNKEIDTAAQKGVLDMKEKMQNKTEQNRQNQTEQTGQGGVIMGWESYDKNGKLSAKSEVKEVNNNFDHLVSVKGYSLRQVNFNQGEKK